MPLGWMFEVFYCYYWPIIRCYYTFVLYNTEKFTVYL